jgi:hypothetical protein
MAQDIAKWAIVRTPNPSKFGFSVTVPQKTIVNNPSAWPEEGSLFKDFPWAPDPSLQAENRYGLYVYTDCQSSSSPERDQAITFVFGPYMTDEQKTTPFRTYTESKNHRWPPILQALAIQQDYTFPNATNVVSGTNVGIVTAPRNYPKYVFIPEVNEGSRFVTEEFFSPTKYDIPQSPVPTATSVNVDILDVSLNFPECLHPKIQIPNTRTGDVQVVAGSATGAGGALNGQVFPATNFETWAVYVLTDQQEFTGVGWHRIRVRVFPPALPDAIVR